MKRFFSRMTGFSIVVAGKVLGAIRSRLGLLQFLLVLLMIQFVVMAFVGIDIRSALIITGTLLLAGCIVPARFLGFKYESLKKHRVFEQMASEMHVIEVFLGRTATYLLQNSVDQQLITQEIKANYNNTKNLIQELDGKLNAVKSASAEAQVLANTGEASLQGLTQSLESMMEISTDLAKLDKVVTNISDKLSSIDNIVYMSTILSLNATIEAARFGKNAGSIAIVAQEMTRLAQSIGETSKEIKGILDESATKIVEIRSFVDKRITDSNMTISQSKGSFEKIITNIYMMNTEISEVASSVEAYASSSQMFAETMNKITKTTANLGTASANNKMAYSNLSELRSTFNRIR